ncbi:MAG TPA: RDD family protein [Usitatibacter sp.]|nr:RDD family protein [Usitatibacter sp.]
MTGPPAAGIARRLASGIYELLILLAVVFIATLPFSYLFGDATQGWKRHLLQAWVLAVTATYFGWFWTHGGQTLPMKTWRLRLVREDGATLRWPQALHRYAIALLGFAALGLGFLWAFFDRDRQFLHDRLVRTRLVDTRMAAGGA